MKRILFRSTLWLMVLCLAIALFAACGEDKGTPPAGGGTQTADGGNGTQNGDTSSDKSDGTTDATPAHTHEYGAWIAEVPATCTEDGVKGHYHCTSCGKDFDAAYAQLADLTIPAAHTCGAWIEEVPATCTEAGVKGHYHCTACGKDLDAAYAVIADLVIPALDHHYEGGVCTRCGQPQPYVRLNAEGKEDVKGNYLLFGSYPQSEETDSGVTAALATQAGVAPTETNSGNWTSYGYYILGEQSDYMWYIDLTYEGETYRGVYFTQYRPYRTTIYESNAVNSYQDDNGYTTGNMYWFRYEPIQWRILQESNGVALILCESILDSQAYQETYVKKSSVYYNDADGVPEDTYANNWQYSAIRAWLNDVFYDTAFTALQKTLIELTTVDNSARSTNLNKYPNRWNGGENICAGSDTEDNVFLLSLKEITNKTYGFKDGYDVTKDPACCKQTSDYSRAMGTLTETSGTDEGNGYWLLRSPYYDSAADSVRSVDASGYGGGCQTINHTCIGVVPALRICLG